MDLIEQYNLTRMGQTEGMVQIYSENSRYWAFTCRHEGKYFSHARYSDEEKSLEGALESARKKLIRECLDIGERIPIKQDESATSETRETEESALASS